MFALRRSFLVAPRLQATSARSIAPVCRYTTATTPQTETSAPTTPSPPTPASADPPTSEPSTPPPVFSEAAPENTGSPVVKKPIGRPPIKPIPKPIPKKAPYTPIPKAVANPPPAKPAPTSTSSTPPPQPPPYDVPTADNRPKKVQWKSKIINPKANKTFDPSEYQNTDWSSSYFGIGAHPVTQEQYNALTSPLNLDDVAVKPDGVVYLPEIKYRRKLNEVFGPMGWGLIPRSDPAVGESIVTREYALIVDGRFVSQSQGENNYFGDDQLPGAVEGCKSNALMRCCKDLGIASELWDPGFIKWFRSLHMEQVWVEHMTTKKKRTFWFRKGEVEVAYPYKLS